MRACRRKCFTEDAAAAKVARIVTADAAVGLMTWEQPPRPLIPGQRVPTIDWTLYEDEQAKRGIIDAPRAIIRTRTPLTEDQARRWRERFAVDALMVLDQGMTWGPTMEPPPSDQSWLKTETVGAYYEVPIWLQVLFTLLPLVLAVVVCIGWAL